MKLVPIAFGFICLLVPGEGKKVISSAKAPQPIGPYSQAIESNGVMYVSGQIGLTPEGKMDTSDFRAECARALGNVSLILAAGGRSWDDVCKSTVYLTDLANYKSFNDLYSAQFRGAFPAREVIQVHALPRNARIELSVIAD